MWTNVFKIGGLHQVSWFQFLPQDSDCNPLPDKSGKLEQKDAATLQVISAHLRLQQEGLLSTWTNSFVGPWDPSQGLHNPDDKIKLWLFLPERHPSVVETAQPAVSRLKVVASGLWLAPGDSEEIAAALSQALRNCIERALSRLSYTRYGDVFTKSRPSQNEELLWRGQPAMEFIFAATDEAIFVHVIISSKHIRALLRGDMEKLSNRSSNQSSYRIPVIVAPHGMRGSLTGCCPSDLVKHVYCRSRTSDEDTMQNYISQGHGGGLGGQNCYVEVKIGCHRSESDKTLQSNPNAIRNLPSYHMAESSGLGNHSSTYEKMFIYPAEAVIVPLLQTSFAKSSLKRVWLQNWIGPYLPSSSFFTHCAGHADSAEGSWNENSRVKTEYGYNSSSNSNCSSLSSVSSSSSDSAYKKTTGSGDLEADADSLTCRNSGLSSRDQLENDSSKLGSKRPRASIAESFGQAGTDFGSADVNTSAITGVGNEQIGTHWDWDDDDRGMGMDIQALLSEFGDFGDFFENDSLPFGEPPGTAESQATMFSPPDCGNGDGSPVLMDVSDQIILPVGFPSFDSFNPSLVVTEECLSKNQEVATSAVTVGPTNFLPPLSTGEFDHVIKAEALMTFAPEYGAVETITSETSSSVFKNPYFPKTLKMNSSNSSPNNYVYGATSPSSPCVGMLDEKSGMVINPKNGPGRHDKDAIHQSGKYYDQVESGKEQSFIRNGTTGTSNGRVASALSTFNSSNAMTSIEGKISDNALGTEHILLSMKSVLATEVECILFQTSMCKIRHMILSSSIPAPANLSRQVLNHLPSDRSTMTDNLSSRYEVKKKESIPVRIAGDFDGGVLDGHVNAPVGVWRSVGGPKASKPTNSANTEATPSLPHHTYSKEGILSFGQKQQLTELLDGMSLLVQQATSFVDVALDADCGDGSYGWLALEEQSRRGLSCGPSMVHAGCGGTLASCHSLDIAGVELIDPLSADIHASSVISLLQSEIKTALKTAFGNVDGPLPVIDWCKGRGQACDTSMFGDGSLAESAIGEGRDSSSTIPLSVGEQTSPTQSSAAGSSGLKSCGMIDGAKLDETCQRRSSQEIESDQQTCSRPRPTLFVLASPAILVGYQDDWLKTSACSLQLWEKAPLEPYAMQKNITYNVICPDIDPLTTAAADFFQQLGTVYETCKLGTHSPHSLGSQMEIDPGKLSSSGFVLLDSPRAMKIESSNASLVGSISDYFLSLSNGWELASYLKSLTKAIKALKINPCLSTNPKEGISCPCTVIYVVCPFPEPVAVLQTVVESCAAAGSVCYATEREKRSALQNHVGKALSVAAVDEALVSNVLVLSGFGIPKLVLQIITIDVVFRVTTPALSELIVLKEIAFTVYNKARRIPRGSSNDLIQSSSFSNRSHSVLTQLTSIPGMWKDCVGGPRMTGTPLPREGEMDVSMRSANWDNSWQSTARTVGLNSDPNRNGELFIHDTVSYMFEPLFILSEPGSLENAISPSVFGNLTSESSKLTTDDAADTGMAPPVDVSEIDGYQKNFPSLHCCYGWTEDWRWLVCVWTDARGELLDTHIFPFGGISSRQDTKGLQCLFVQVLQQGCQILQACALSDTGAVKPRDFVIARIGSFYELEYLEWQKAIFSVGGSEVKKWPLQLRRFVPDGMPVGNNGTSLQQEDMSLIQDRTVLSSPNAMYSAHSKTTGFIKSGLGQANMRNSRGILQWVQSISFATISVDHTLNIVLQADSPSSGGVQGSSSSSSTGPSAYVEGFSAVKSLGCTASTSYLLIPSPSMRFLPTTPLQLPTCLTADSPPLAHLLHSKGFAIPLSTGFAISKAVPSLRKDMKSSNLKDEWPCVLSVSLIDYYGGNNNNILRGLTKQGGVRTTTTTTTTTKDFETESHLIVENIVAELHALSWMTISPAYIERRSALPFHCDMVLRLRRLIHFADKELSQPERS